MSTKTDSPEKAKPPAARGKSESTAYRARWAILCLAILAVAGGTWFGLWQQVRDHVLASGDYHLDPASIRMTPLPEWIHADVRAEVIRDASLDASLSILQPDLTVLVARAFSMHPWIAKVQRVSKHYPAGLDVEVEYRRPAAMVEVPGGLFPVDAEGVLLPCDDFAPKIARGYPRLGEITSAPAGPVGTSWGDARVTDGALIAAALANKWQSLRLYRIVPAAGAREGARDNAFEIYTHAGTRILWGRAPGREPGDEATAADKIDRLARYAADNGSLEGASGPQQVNVRGAARLTVAPRVVIKPLPPEQVD